MQCAQVRAALLANPHDDLPELRRHVDGCADCTRFAAQLLQFDDRLGRALRLALPARAATVTRLEPAATRPAPAARRPGRSWLAAAASVLLGLVVAGGLWLADPGPSLAAAVVGHMAGEPDAWARSDVAVSAPKIEDVMAASGLQLKPGAGLVSYANSCLFRGYQVPHLVVQTVRGPVTVMVLVHEPVRKARRFDEQGYHGMIVPVPGHGSIAVLGRGEATDMAAVEGVAQQVLRALAWTA